MENNPTTILQNNVPMQTDKFPYLNSQKGQEAGKNTFFKIIVISAIISIIGGGVGVYSVFKEKKTVAQVQKQNITIPPSSGVPVIPTVNKYTGNTVNNVSINQGDSAMIGPCRVFPPDNPWNQDISNYPVNPMSSSYLSSIGLDKSLHPDFGGASYGKSWGIPYTTVNNSQAGYPVNFTAYGNESDPGPYPVPMNAPVEGGSDSSGDRHVLVVNTDTCILYELYRAFPTQSGWNADSGAIFDLKLNKLRPERWTSADAAGLPIFPGLVRFDEVASGSVNHAIRFTTRKTQRAYIHPATHFASASTDGNLPPMGLRVRLKADYDLSNLSRQAKVIAQAMKKYGLILADNGGDWFFQGDENKSWIDEDINTLKSIKGSAFVAVDTGPLIK